MSRRVHPAAQALYQKQGRSSQFASKQERDDWIREEVRTLERAAAVKRSSADELRGQVQQLSSQLMDLSQVSQQDQAVSCSPCCEQGLSLGDDDTGSMLFKP